MKNIFLETERLYLRKIEKADFDELSIMLKNPNVMYAWEYTFSDKEVWDWIEKNLNFYEKYNLGYFLAIDKKTAKVIGQAALMPDFVNGEDCYEIGYILKEEYFDKGYASESAKALAKYAFKNLNLDKVIFEIRPENTPSRKVASRLGAKISGEFVKNVGGKKMTHLVYTLYS